MYNNQKEYNEQKEYNDYSTLSAKGDTLGDSSNISNR
jgi:hypothetical protein